MTYGKGWRVYLCGKCKEKFMVTKYPNNCPYCRVSRMSVQMADEPPVVIRSVTKKVLVKKE